MTVSSPSSSASQPWLRPEIVGSWREIVFVILITIGPFAGSSIMHALRGSADKYVELLASDRRLLGSVAFEGPVLAALLWLLHRRGWTPSDFQMKVTWQNSLRALRLFGVMEVMHIISMVGLFLLVYSLQTHFKTFEAFLVANSPHLAHHSVILSWSVILVAMVLNAFLEEITCTAYVFNQLAARLGPLAALLGTVLLRMACHTYQGPLNCLGIGVVFLVFGLWYWRFRSVWTLVLAHIILDVGAMSFLKVFYS